MRKIFLLLVLTISFVSSAGVDIVVHPSNADAFSKSDISRIFLGKAKTFPGGAQAVPINQAEGSEITKHFNSLVLSKSSSQLKAYWSKLVFTGKGTPPKAVINDSEVVQLISSNPNMIGYVPSGSAGSEVKVIASF